MNKSYLFHPSTIVLILINLFTIIFAIIEQWDIFVLLILYAIQGLIIGGFHYFKTLRLKEVDLTDFEKNFSMRGTGYVSPVGMTPEKAKRTTAWFFLTGYGMFHLIYLIFIPAFIAATGNKTALSSQGIFSTTFILLIVGYFITHWISYVLSKPEAEKKTNLGKYLNEPVNRILPIHLTIVFGGFFITILGGQMILLILFLILKTILDVNTHIKQHEKHTQL